MLGSKVNSYDGHGSRVRIAGELDWIGNGIVVDMDRQRLSESESREQDNNDLMRRSHSLFQLFAQPMTLMHRLNIW